MKDRNGKEVVVGSEVIYLPHQCILDVTWAGHTRLTGDDGGTEYQGVESDEIELVRTKGARFEELNSK